mgnify:CR=1 FL=1
MNMKVIFNHRKGKVEEMNIRFAKILQGLGKGSYLTRDMRHEPIVPEIIVTIETEPEEAPKKRGRPAKNKD